MPVVVWLQNLLGINENVNASNRRQFYDFLLLLYDIDTK